MHGSWHMFAVKIATAISICTTNVSKVPNATHVGNVKLFVVLNVVYGKLARVIAPEVNFCGYRKLTLIIYLTVCLALFL